MKDNFDQFANRFKKVLGKESVNSFAKKCGVSESLFRKYLTGSLPGTKQLVNISETANVNLEWLATGKGPMRTDELAPLGGNFKIVNLEGHQVDVKPDPDLCHLPVLSIEAACGNGVVVDEEYAKAVFSATRHWFRRELGRNPESLCLIQARGDSMAETIKPEELVFVDHTCSHEPTDGIWVFRHEEGLFLKRLQFLPGHQVKVKSDNPHYEPYTVKLNGSFKLLGQVIGALPLRRL